LNSMTEIQRDDTMMRLPNLSLLLGDVRMN
jgi:hypothetical protein